MAAHRDIVLGIVALRAERRSWVALMLAWVALGIAFASLAITCWRYFS